MIIREDIPIRFVGGPFDEQTAPPTHRDEVELIAFPETPIESRISDQVPNQQDAPAYRHRYRRNTTRPWIFDYCP